MPVILTAHLFQPLDANLIDLLESLSPEEWSANALPKWTVKDIAAHLLDSTVRRLSIGRDGHWGVPFSGNSPQELIEFLNGLNHDWVRACRRLSPRVLVQLLRGTLPELARYFGSLDPMQEAVFGVSWAGEEKSLNWFDIAREYTEKWHHQQQIRDAVGRPGIMTPELYGPVVATFMRVLPHTFRPVNANEGTAIQFKVVGVGGGDWTLVRSGPGWRLDEGAGKDLVSEVVIPSQLAWKLFTKGLPKEVARAQIQITGDCNLAESVFSATAIVG